MNPFEPNAGRFIKSSYSTATCTCVEVLVDRRQNQVFVRDSKQVVTVAGREISGPVICVSVEEWSAFVEHFRARGHGPTDSEIRVDDSGADVILRSGGVRLSFFRAEWDAFLDGLQAGEFSLAA